MKSATRLLAVLAVSVLSVAAFADEASMSDSKGPWGGGAELNANITTGNTDIQTIGAAAEIDYRGQPLDTSLKASWMRNRTALVERARRTDVALRTGMHVTNNLDFFGLGEYYQNRFRGLDKQWLVEAGLGAYVVNNDQAAIRFEGGFGYMNENFYPVFLQANKSRSFLVGTGGLGLRLKLSDVAELTDDVLYINHLSQSTDWRMNNTVGLVSHMTKTLSLKVSYMTEYRKIPVPGYRATDNTTLGALVLKF